MKKSIAAVLTVLAVLAGTPVCAATDAGTDYAQAPEVSAQSAIVMEAATGVVLYEKDADATRPMASTTKLMTALVAAEAGGLDDVVTVPKQAVEIEGSSVYLQEGEHITVRELIYATLLCSGNDATEALAYHYGDGERSAFVQMMNEKAAELGLQSTQFENPSGLPADGHYTTARELAEIGRAVSRNAFLSEVVGTRAVTLQNEDGYTRRYVNHNTLLKLYEYADGMKTGFTKAAGRCLVSSATKNGVKLICVTLHAPDDWNDHTHLLDWAFENYEYRCVAGDTPVYAVPVLSATVELCAAAPERPAYLLVHPDDPVSLKAELPRFTFAPVEQGAQAGTLTATGPDGQSVTVPLRYAEPAALDPDVKITPLARLGRLWTHACRYFSSYYYSVS